MTDVSVHDVSIQCTKFGLIRFAMRSVDHLWLVLIISINIHVTYSVYQSSSEISRLSLTQQAMIDVYESQNREEETIIRAKQRQKAIENDDKFFHNPINAFIMISRLFEEMDDDMRQSLSNKNLPVPDTIDVEGATQALIRLQRIYQLETNDFVRGMIRYSGKEYNASGSLSPKECELLGLEAMRFGYFEQAIEWLTESAKQSQVMSEEIFGNMTLANQQIEEQRNTFRNIEFERTEAGKFEELCSGRLTKKSDSRLKCFHWKSKEPFLKLSIIKAEEVNRDPEIYRFYDVASDDEIERLVLSKEKFAKIEENRLLNGQIRKLIHMDHTVDETTRILDQRVGDITGLSLESAERLRVSDYGVGGFFGLHCDSSEDEDQRLNDRIATWMYYLSDVEAGGKTVFIEPDVTVSPIKGTAVFWYDKYLSGFTDLLAKHGACPVLFGVKLTANKFPHEFGQEFRRPCGLTIDA